MRPPTVIRQAGAAQRAPRRRCGGKLAPLTVSRPELTTGGSDQDFRAFVHGMLAFSARLEAVRSGFASYVGLTGIQYTILMSVNHLEHKGRVSVGMIAGHLHLSGAFVTIETGRLVRRGLLAKDPDPQDRRRVRLSLTRKGCALLQTLAPIQVQVNDVLFEFLDAQQFRRLHRMMERMTACGDRAVGLLEYLVGEPRRASR